MQQFYHFDFESNALREQVINHRRGDSADGPRPMEKWQHRLEVIVKRLVAAFDGEEIEYFWASVFIETSYGSEIPHGMDNRFRHL